MRSEKTVRAELKKAHDLIKSFTPAHRGAIDRQDAFKRYTDLQRELGAIELAKVPSISMKAFFQLAEVKRLQDVQKANPYGSKAHKDAFDGILAIAKTYNAQSYFGEY